VRSWRISTLAVRGLLLQQEDFGPDQKHLRKELWTLWTNKVRCCEPVRLEVGIKSWRVSLINKGPLSSDQNRFNETPEQIGIEFVYWHLPESSIRYQVMFTFVITRISTVFGQILFSRVLSSGLVESTGVQLALGRVTGPGWRLALPVTAKIRAPSFGVAMTIKRMLYLMNLEEQSTWPIFSDGLTNIRSEWKPRGARDH